MTSSGLQVNWAALTLFVVFAGALLGNAGRAFSAPDRMEQKYGERQKRARAAIDTDYIVPALADLVSNVFSRASVTGLFITSVDEEAPRGGDGPLLFTKDQLIDNLEWAGHLQDLDAVANHYQSYKSVDSLLDLAGRRIRLQWMVSCAIAVLLIFPAVYFIFPSELIVPTPIWLIAGGLALVLSGVTLVLWVQEKRALNAISQLFRRYVD